MSPSSQDAEQALSPSRITPSSQSQALEPQQASSVQSAYLSSAWNSFRSYSQAQEIQMMTIPQGQYVITEAPVSTPVGMSQMKPVTQTHYVISDGQNDLQEKQDASLSEDVSTGAEHNETLEQQQMTQYIITTTTNGNGGSEVHISKS